MKAQLLKASTISALILSAISCNAKETPMAKEVQDTQPTKEKAMAEVKWHNLLEGDKLDQWRSWRRGGIENAPAWTVKDGVLHLNKEDKKPAGSIITIKQYPNFELKFEFKVTEACNSGIKYRSLDNLGLEYQILDDVSSKDNKNPLNKLSSLYQLVGAPDDKPIKPVGEWNTGRIIANGNNIQHWLNGTKVVEIEIDSEEWKAAFAKSKYRDKAEFAKQSAEILIQDHGDEVFYRNLLIREIK